MNKISKAYKIWNKDTGLFSAGGSTPKWNKSGKSWASIGALKNHLRLVQEHHSNYKRRGPAIPPSWLVVVAEVIVTEGRTYASACDLVSP